MPAFLSYRLPEGYNAGSTRDLADDRGTTERELSLRTSATGQARGQHTQALAIARDISAAPEEARA